MQEVIIKPFTGCYLIVRGIYTKGEEDVNFAPQFEIESIKSTSDDLYYLLEWVANNQKHYLDIIEELCIEQIENK